MKKRIFLSPPDMTGKELELIKEVFESNYIAPVGPMIKRFEEEFCEYTGFKYACAVSSGTAAIHLGLIILGVDAGDSVISTDLTFIGGVNPILYQKAKPIFIGVDESFTINPNILLYHLKMMEKYEALPSAVILTDLYGQCCDMKRLLTICNHYKIPTLVDACESLGSIVYKQHAGKGADIAAFSFNGNKIITTSGGGMIASDNKEYIDKARYLSTAAVEPGYDYYQHKDIGYNYRMSNVVAAIGVGQLDALDEKIGKKRAIFEGYQKRLGDIKEIDFMQEMDYGVSSRWQCVMHTEKISPIKLKNALEKENIESRLVFKPMHLQPIFNRNFCIGVDVGNYFFQHGLCLPCGTSMTEEDLDRVCEVIVGTLK